MQDSSSLPVKDISNSLKEYKMPMHELRSLYMKQLLSGHQLAFDLPAPFGTQYHFDCIGQSYMSLLIGRKIGIPMSIDYTPHWSNRNGRHYWNSIIDPYMKKVTISEPTSAKNAKIYRKTFHHNRVPISHENEYIPYLFQSPFNEDITDLYLYTADIEIECPNLPCKNKNIYMAVFNEQRWEPIAWSDKRTGEKVFFKKMGLGNIYQPIYYNNKRELVLGGYPLKLDTQGKVTYLIPDKSNLTNMTLKRKYPLIAKKLHWSSSLVGTTILATNDPTFATCDTLATINNVSYEAYYELPILTKKQYRYWKIINPASMTQFAEIEFLRNGEKIPVSDIKNDLGKTIDNFQFLFDENPLTYAAIYKSAYISLEQPRYINSVKLTPRNDDNYITPGNLYELFYQDINGWISLGKQIAEKNNLHFKNVPSNAIYWLRNLSTGNEERIFTYENGKVVFW